MQALHSNHISFCTTLWVSVGGVEKWPTKFVMPVYVHILIKKNLFQLFQRLVLCSYLKKKSCMFKLVFTKGNIFEVELTTLALLLLPTCHSCPASL